MSKRFGRNQKRAMRELLDRKCRELKAAGNEIEYWRGRTHDNQLVVDMLRELIPSHFCAIRAQQLTGISDTSTQINLPQPFPDCDFTRADAPPVTIRKMAQALDVMRIDFENDVDPLNLREMRHVILRYRSGKAVYAIAQNALDNISIDLLARELAELAKLHFSSRNKPYAKH